MGPVGHQRFMGEESLCRTIATENEVTAWRSIRQDDFFGGKGYSLKEINTEAASILTCGWEEGRTAMSSTPGIAPSSQFRTLLLSEQLEFIVRLTTD